MIQNRLADSLCRAELSPSEDASICYSSSFDYIFDLQMHKSDEKFGDTRNSVVYPLVKIGNKIWMGANLNYKDSTMSFARCYGVFENSINDICDEMGFLYNFESAKNACPEGFHLPRKDELEEFIRKVGENDSRRLKTQTGWKEQYNGTNSLGFSANGAGYFHNAANGYDLELEYLGLWSSTQEGMDNAYVLAINRNLPISIEIDDIDDGYSIRCIRD